MVNYTRRNTDPYSWSYHNDLIAAVGDDLHYHVSLGIGEKFEDFLHEFYHVMPPSFFPIYFVNARETEQKLPMLGVITPHYGMMRVLEHPVAREFRECIPWIFRDTLYAMQQLLAQFPSHKTLPEIYKTIEDLRWINHKIVQRTVLGEILQQLQLTTFGNCWEAISTTLTQENWITNISTELLSLKKGKSYHIRLPLPRNEHYCFPMLIFWMQLLKATLRFPYKYWKLYWTEGALLFINGPHRADDVGKLLTASVEENPNVPSPFSLDITTEMTLVQLLACWREALKLQ